VRGAASHPSVKRREASRQRIRRRSAVGGMTAGSGEKVQNAGQLHGCTLYSGAYGVG